MTYEILLAGFGGQGILFAGKLLAYCALFEGTEISWRQVQLLRLHFR